MKPLTWASTPVLNFSGMPVADMERYLAEEMAWMRLPRESGMDCVGWAKAALGRQDYCLVGSGNRRFHVWEAEDETWRLFVHNVKGLCFEVAEGTEHDAVVKVWDAFRKKAGIGGPP